MSLDGACISIADTILEFANVVISQMPEPQALESLRQTIELAVSVWNAHTLASPVWNQPEHLNELSRLISLSASPQILAAFEALRSRGAQRIAAASYHVGPGYLVDRMVWEARRAGAMAITEPLGDCPELAELVRLRAGAADPVHTG